MGKASSYRAERNLRTFLYSYVVKPPLPKYFASRLRAAGMPLILTQAVGRALACRTRLGRVRTENATTEVLSPAKTDVRRTSAAKRSPLDLCRDATPKQGFLVEASAHSRLLVVDGRPLCGYSEQS
eukprot:scaffold1951_cov258-Pinguiococcus_pyrenoidosus.AAC.10